MFTRQDGSPLRPEYVTRHFQALAQDAGLPVIRLHDLRHTFIVHSMLRFYEVGGDVEPMLPLLSIYVGHAKVVDTYWYISGIPELMALAAERFHRYVQGASS